MHGLFSLAIPRDIERLQIEFQTARTPLGTTARETSKCRNFTVKVKRGRIIGSLKKLAPHQEGYSLFCPDLS